MFVSFNSNTTGVSSGTELLTLPEHLSLRPLSLVGFVLFNLLFSVWCFVNHCLSFFYLSLRCLSFFDLHFLIAPLASATFLSGIYSGLPRRPLTSLGVFPKSNVNSHILPIWILVDFASFYDVSIGFWNCSDSVVFFFLHFIHLTT